MTRTYRALDPGRVVETIGKLGHRIAERFPGSDLASVCGELLTLADESSARADAIAKRNLPLRIGIFGLIAAGAGALVWVGVLLLTSVSATADNVYSVLQGIEAAANITVLIGAGVFFIARIEERLKRRSALKALHELRSIVHVIDMHQLTKDPSAMIEVGDNTPSSPTRPLSRFELTRYLDYCSEMLSLTSKVAVLYAQKFPESTVVEAVSDIERIAAGLSQKIWQKIMIVEAMGKSGEKAAPPG